ncbi:MAG: hypothetical protein GY839_04340, partial [candidate division Zixibacteria bacterium]|nr:hypothetical protein [candidate division Zixibacteria bacterium]
MSDLDIIKKLEKELGFELPRLEKIEWNSVGFNTDEQRNLIGISIYDKALKKLPSAIAEMEKLQKLDLRRNQLTALPDTIAELKNLQELDLNNNQLTALPDTIAELKKLQI